jgi:hypothetical protein
VISVSHTGLFDYAYLDNDPERLLGQADGLAPGAGNVGPDLGRYT